MADNEARAADQPHNSEQPTFDEKQQYGQQEEKNTNLPGIKPGEDEEEDEDMDALIEELESQDANIDAEEEDTTQPGGARLVAEELLQTSTVHGLTTEEVTQRRKKFGLNQMKEEKENLVLKFLMYFVGPIQFVMEVRNFVDPRVGDVADLAVALGCRYSRRRSAGLGRFWCHLRASAAQRDCRFRPRIPGRFHCRRVEKDARPQGHRVAQWHSARSRGPGNCSW